MVLHDYSYTHFRLSTPWYQYPLEWHIGIYYNVDRINRNRFYVRRIALRISFVKYEDEDRKDGVEDERLQLRILFGRIYYIANDELCTNPTDAKKVIYAGH